MNSTPQLTWDQAYFFFASLLFWLERKKNNAWYIYLTSHQPPPNLHNLTSAWPVMLLVWNSSDCFESFSMPSNPGQNVHLVSSQIHAVASSSHLANSSSQLVVLSSYLVESSSHLVVLSILLTSPLPVYSSVILQLVVSHFNSSCRTSTRRSLYPSSGQAVSRYK